MYDCCALIVIVDCSQTCLFLDTSQSCEQTNIPSRASHSSSVGRCPAIYINPRVACSLTNTLNTMNADTYVNDCSVHGNYSLLLFVIVLPFYANIGSDTMRRLQDQILIMDQTTQPKQWTIQELQKSITNRCIIHDMAYERGTLSTVCLPPLRPFLFSDNACMATPTNHMVVSSIPPMMTMTRTAFSTENPTMTNVVEARVLLVVWMLA